MKEHLNTLGAILAAGLGIILTYWVSYYFWERPEPTAPTYNIEKEPVKEIPATKNWDNPNNAKG